MVLSDGSDHLISFSTFSTCTWNQASPSVNHIKDFLRRMRDVWPAFPEGLGIIIGDFRMFEPEEGRCNFWRRRPSLKVTRRAVFSRSSSCLRPIARERESLLMASYGACRVLTVPSSMSRCQTQETSSVEQVPWEMPLCLATKYLCSSLWRPFFVPRAEAPFEGSLS